MEDYSYELPQELVALEPVEPRDTCRLMIYDTKKDSLSFDVFSNISRYIPTKTLIVLNSTKVQPSRIVLKKRSTGGKIIVLVLLNEINQSGNISVMLDRKAEKGEILMFSDNEIFEIKGHKYDSIFEVRMLVSENKLVGLLEKSGTMPIPLYLRKTGLSSSELKNKYQTIFASGEGIREKTNDLIGSVAAPTASLHFTENVFLSLKEKEIEKVHIKLEVGLGTFAPLTEENLQNSFLHKEWYKIRKEEKLEIIEAKKTSRKIMACGTTVVRALESWGLSLRNSDDYESTRIFIRPGHEFKLVDILLTNFHLPNSSLMMLVEAFLQSKNAKRSLVDLYNIAIEKRFRFFSFGDAMLII